MNGPNRHLILGNETTIAGVSVSELAERYGTPTYVYASERIAENYARFADAFSIFDKRRVFYAIKACSNPHIAAVLTNLGVGIDAASPNEVLLALSLGVSRDDVMYTGNSLSDGDIRFALDLGVHFNVDDHGIVGRILDYKVPERLCFRVNVGSPDESGILDFSGDQSKFGILPDRLDTPISLAVAAGVARISLHMMPGSNRLDEAYFIDNSTRLSSIAVEISRRHRINIDMLDLGGGIGIPYTDEERPIDLKSMFAKVHKSISSTFSAAGLAMPTIAMEPARYFVGDAAILIGRVNSIKRDRRTIVGTDISMNTMARTVLYGKQHRIHIDTKLNHATIEAGICGQVCENTDYKITDAHLPESISPGDLVVMRDVGAYGYSMAYDYNGRVTPAEVIAQAGSHRLIRRRKTFTDLMGLVEGHDPHPFASDVTAAAAVHKVEV